MLTLSEIVELKSIVKSGTGTELHFHDVCPKPFFMLDKADSEIQEIINTFLSSKKHIAVYSADGLQFTIERNRLC